MKAYNLQELMLKETKKQDTQYDYSNGQGSICVGHMSRRIEQYQVYFDLYKHEPTRSGSCAFTEDQCGCDTVNGGGSNTIRTRYLCFDNGLILTLGETYNQLIPPPVGNFYHEIYNNSSAKKVLIDLTGKIHKIGEEDDLRMEKRNVGGGHIYIAYKCDEPVYIAITEDVIKKLDGVKYREFCQAEELSNFLGKLKDDAISNEVKRILRGLDLTFNNSLMVNGYFIQREQSQVQNLADENAALRAQVRKLEEQLKDLGNGYSHEMQ